MTDLRHPNNPVVFMDIRVGLEIVGRVIIELRKDVVPKTVENFRCLCTGEKGIGANGKPLHYKGIKFHKVQRLFMVQGGDIVKNDGSSGESIYGPLFDDESLELPHEAGSVGMAHFGRPNSNNSQFFVTTVDSPHCDGSNVVFGKVLRGLGCLQEMEKYASDDSEPLLEMTVDNCGEILPEEDWNYCDNDKSEDKLPPFPEDWDEKTKDFTVEEAVRVLESIKAAGNMFFKEKNYVESCRKYKKTVRYFNYFKDKLETKYRKGLTVQKLREKLQCVYQINSVVCLNLAAVELKLNNVENAKNACDEVLSLDPCNAKALYRRGQAHIGLKNYDDALIDLEQAYRSLPKDKNIQNEYQRAKEIWRNYQNQQRNVYKNLFERI
ncbi:peptidyl-prolyl cis-trans isomerase D isoform X2 [Contarinia nasturtii]|uniref:peptidyl-prolyl cis-trans isomerase D isoform X2 n=1 Tax=Contarinia nasturtii TaxID=265458 RepID=UPI0012D3D4BD|nr:peptidyl-prolyl cis-trans isomerase D isoform X2 [Contarinia nasturtii]